MTNIEELAQAVIQSPQLKDAIREHLSSCLSELKQTDDNNDVKLDHLVG